MAKFVQILTKIKGIPVDPLELSVDVRAAPCPPWTMASLLNCSNPSIQARLATTMKAGTRMVTLVMMGLSDTASSWNRTPGTSIRLQMSQIDYLPWEDRRSKVSA